VETLTEISFIRWDRQGHHPVREEVRRSAARAVDEIAAFQIACRKGGASPPALLLMGKDHSFKIGVLDIEGFLLHPPVF